MGCSTRPPRVILPFRNHCADSPACHLPRGELPPFLSPACDFTRARTTLETAGPSPRGGLSGGRGLCELVWMRSRGRRATATFFFFFLVLVLVCESSFSEWSSPSVLPSKTESGGRGEVKESAVRARKTAFCSRVRIVCYLLRFLLEFLLSSSKINLKNSPGQNF